jgi:hypothetical protein
MDSQQPYGREDLMKILEEYLKEIDKSRRYDQYSYKSSDEISRSIEKLKKWLEETDKILKYNQHSYKSSKEEEVKWHVKSSISELERLLYEKIIETQEETGISKIKRASTLIYLKCLEFDDGSISCEPNIEAYLHTEKNEVITCYTTLEHSLYEIECTHDGFEPSFYFQDSFSFIKSIQDPLLTAYRMLKWGRLLKGYNEEYRSIHIKTDAFTNPNDPTKENPEMKIGKNSISFYNGRSYIGTTLKFYVFNSD